MKARIARKEWLSLIAAWIGITYFYFFLTWGTFSDLVVPNALTEYVEKGYSHLEILLFGVFFGASFAGINTLADNTYLRRKPFGYIILMKSLLYLLSIVLVAIIIWAVFRFSGLMTTAEAKATMQGLPLKYFASFIAYFVLSIFMVNVAIQVNRKFGPGVLVDLITGKYHRPHEEGRIFMFLDLKGSTTIAEKLGHNTYSQLIRNCFYDLTDIVLAHKAHIYQYVGDEVVLSWKESEGLSGLNCFRLFLAFDRHLEKRKPFYLERFGVAPVFKAGLDAGVVTVAEIGEIKREIAYHGDVLNTASRIEGMCNQLNRKILFSEHLARKINGRPGLNYELMGEMQLRGKEEKLRIYSLADFGVSSGSNEKESDHRGKLFFLG